MSTIPGYSSPLALGHRFLGERYFEGTTIVQEKIDGSQISFGVRDGKLFVRSRRVELDLNDAGMFGKAVQTIQGLFKSQKLVEGWTYRGEFLGKPKHNTLDYDRVPKDFIILFDIDMGNQDYVNNLSFYAFNLGLEAAPIYWTLRNLRPSQELIDQWMLRPSILGGPIEGIVMKNYAQLGQDKKVAMAKYVSTAFKERHGESWKLRHPGPKDVVLSIIDDLRTDARWKKAVQHLQEAGQLTGTPKDIGALMKEVQNDVRQEVEEEIKNRLFDTYWKQITRGITAGLPEWYKDQLAFGEPQ